MYVPQNGNFEFSCVSVQLKWRPLLLTDSSSKSRSTKDVLEQNLQLFCLPGLVLSSQKEMKLIFAQDSSKRLFIPAFAFAKENTDKLA